MKLHVILKLHIKNLRYFEKIFEIFEGLIKFHPSKISTCKKSQRIEEKEGKRIALTYIPLFHAIISTTIRNKTHGEANTPTHIGRTRTFKVRKSSSIFFTKFTFFT